MDEKVKSKRGFASMDPEKQREIASKGGKRAHELGTAHEFTRQEASLAGKKGGQTAAAKGQKYMSEMGRKGGKARALMSNSSVDDTKPTE